METKKWYQQIKIAEQYIEVNEEVDYNFGFIRRLQKNGLIKIIYKQDDTKNNSTYSLEDWYNKENRVV